MDPATIRLAVGLSHLAGAVAVWYFGLARRFPWLSVHLALEGVAQVGDGFIPGAYRANYWAWSQIPRLVLRGLVVWEVSRESTRKGLDPLERVGLWWAAGLACVLAGVALWFFSAMTSGQPVNGWYAGALVARQYILLGFASWLVLVNGYLLWTRTSTDWNLTVYRAVATIGAATAFLAASFVAGGLGYRIMEFDKASWWQVHDWRSWCAMIFVAALGLLVRPDEPELE